METSKAPCRTPGELVARNPGSPRGQFARFALLLQAGRHEEALASALSAHRLCWHPQALNQALSALASCFTHKKDYKTAAALHLVALHYHYDRLGMEALAFLQRVTALDHGADLDLGTVAAEVSALLDRAAVPRRPDPRWASLVRHRADVCRQEGDVDRAEMYAEVALALVEIPDIRAVLARLRDDGLEQAPSPVADQADDARTWIRRLQACLLSHLDRDEASEVCRRLRGVLHDVSEGREGQHVLREMVDHPEAVGVTTPYTFDRLVVPMGERLLALGKKAGLPLTRSVIWAAIPLRRNTAMVVATPAGEKAVLVTSGLMTFCHLLAKIVAGLVPSRKDGEGFTMSFDWDAITPNLGQPGAADERLVDILTCAARDDVISAKPYTQKTNTFLTDSLCQSAEAFALGGLITLAAHQAPLCEDQKPQHLPRHLVLERFVVTERAQHIADAAGRRLAIELDGEGREPLPLVLAGIDLYLTALAAVEDLRGGQPLSEWSPTRAEARQRWLRASLPDMGLSPEVTFVGDTACRIFTTLLERNRARIEHAISSRGTMD